MTDDLLEGGVEKFVKPFASLMNSVGEKMARLQAEWRRVQAHLGVYQEAVDVALDELAWEDIIDRPTAEGRYRERPLRPVRLASAARCPDSG